MNAGKAEYLFLFHAAIEAKDAIEKHDAERDALVKIRKEKQEAFRRFAERI